MNIDMNAVYANGCGYEYEFELKLKRKNIRKNKK
jgi:hypothetical protein